MSLAQFFNFLVFSSSFFFLRERGKSLIVRIFKQRNFNLEEQNSKYTPDDQKNIVSQSRYFLMQKTLYLSEKNLSS